MAINHDDDGDDVDDHVDDDTVDDDVDDDKLPIHYSLELLVILMIV